MNLSVTDRAKAKLERIIAAEGDVDGQRREPEYLDALVEEEVQMEIAAARFDGRVLRDAV